MLLPIINLVLLIFLSTISSLNADLDDSYQFPKPQQATHPKIVNSKFAPPADTSSNSQGYDEKLIGSDEAAPASLAFDLTSDEENQDASKRDYGSDQDSGESDSADSQSKQSVENKKASLKKVKDTVVAAVSKDSDSSEEKESDGSQDADWYKPKGSFQSDDDLSAVEDYDKRKKREVEEDSGSSFSSSESDFQDFSSEE
uniref:Uncharacterized protein n=1 Tax=Ditylenchus dipsaci TaxID=166011 RepID=A0A915D4F3_9BILA